MLGCREVVILGMLGCKDVWGFWDAGMLGCWKAVRLGCRDAMMQRCQDAGMQGYGDAGMLGCRLLNPFACQEEEASRQGADKEALVK